jgi:hypothetical protein
MGTRKDAKQRLRAWHGENLQELLRSEIRRRLEADFLRQRWHFQPDEIATEAAWLDLRRKWLHELHPFELDYTRGPLRGGAPRMEDGRVLERVVWWHPADAAAEMGRARPGTRSVAVLRPDGWTDLFAEAHEDWPRATEEQLRLRYAAFTHQVDLMAWQFWLPEEIALWAVLNPKGVPARLDAYLDANPLYPIRWCLRWEPTLSMMLAVGRAARATDDVRRAAAHLVPAVVDQPADLLRPPPPEHLARSDARSADLVDATNRERVGRRPAGLFRMDMQFGVACPDEVVREAARQAKAAAAVIAKVLGRPQVQRHRSAPLLRAAPDLELPPGYDPRDPHQVEAHVLDAVAAVDGEDAVDDEEAEFDPLRQRTNARRHRVRLIRRGRYGEESLP